MDEQSIFLEQIFFFFYPKDNDFIKANLTVFYG